MVHPVEKSDLANLNESYCGEGFEFKVEDVIESILFNEYKENSDKAETTALQISEGIPSCERIKKNEGFIYEFVVNGGSKIEIQDECFYEIIRNVAQVGTTVSEYLGAIGETLSSVEKLKNRDGNFYYEFNGRDHQIDIVDMIPGACP